MENDQLSDQPNIWLARIVLALAALVLVTAAVTAYLWLRPPASDLAAQELVFVTGQYGEQLDLVLSDASGRRATRLTDTPDIELFPAWSPDGKSLAFLRGSPSVFVGSGRRASAGSSSGIVLMTFEDDKPKEDLLVKAEEAGLGSPAWSPDGRAIAFLTPAAQADAESPQFTHLVLVDVAAKTYETIPLTVTVPMLQEAPSWSPEGSALAFVAYSGVFVGEGGGGQPPPPFPPDAWVYDLGSRTLTRIVEEVSMVRWSPAGEFLAYVTQEGDGVFRVRRNGTEVVSLLEGAHVFDLAWSPDGTRLAACGWSERQQTYQLAIVAVETGAVTVLPIASVDAAPEFLAWSQDGAYLSYSLFSEGGGQLPEADLWVMDVQSGEAALLADQPGMQALVSWRPVVAESEPGE